jgi:hypothetical protein
VEITNNGVNSVFYTATAQENTKQDQAQNVPVAATMTDPLAQVAAKYDMHNISPVQIDQMADEMFAAGSIAERDYMMMKTRGADFLSHLPGNYYTSERLNTGYDLINKTEWEISEHSRRGDSPTDYLKNMLDVFKELDARRNLPKDGILA